MAGGSGRAKQLSAVVVGTGSLVSSAGNLKEPVGPWAEQVGASAQAQRKQDGQGVGLLFCCRFSRIVGSNQGIFPLCALTPGLIHTLKHFFLSFPFFSFLFLFFSLFDGLCF